jgi:peptidoglycan/xylan/chitin deacetylase (PgdA/CDA1 family)
MPTSRPRRRRVAALLLATLAAAGNAVGGSAHAADAPPPVVRSGVAGCGRIALTCDLCPVRDPHGYDEKLVELLVTTGTPATFFASGRWMAKHEDRVAELLAVPFFELGTHGATHAHLRTLSADAQEKEIAAAVALLAAKRGASPTLFRPPYGEYDATTARVAAALGQTVVLWSAVSGDPSPASSAAHMLAALKPQLRDGAIVIMHANGRGVHTRELLGKLLPAIAAAGLTPVTVGELLQPCPDATAS